MRPLLSVFLSRGVIFRTYCVFTRELGVAGIQMEIAQYYLLAHLYGKKIAGLYVISDLPMEGETVWETGFRHDEAIFDGCERSVDVLLQAIELLAE